MRYLFSNLLTGPIWTTIVDNNNLIEHVDRISKRAMLLREPPFGARRTTTTLKMVLKCFSGEHW